MFLQGKIYLQEILLTCKLFFPTIMIFSQKLGYCLLIQKALKNSLIIKERKHLLLSLNLNARGEVYF
jgi:hypothetical protein